MLLHKTLWCIFPNLVTKKERDDNFKTSSFFHVFHSTITTTKFQNQSDELPFPRCGVSYILSYYIQIGYTITLHPLSVSQTSKKYYVLPWETFLFWTCKDQTLIKMSKLRNTSNITSATNSVKIELEVASLNVATFMPRSLYWSMAACCSR